VIAGVGKVDYSVSCVSCASAYVSTNFVLEGLGLRTNSGLIAEMSLLGVGTALVYPTLLAAISDIAHPQWRATSLGVYRFWRDLGFVFGAIGIGFIADVFNLNIAIQAVAWISMGSGIFVLVFMRETRKGSKTTIRK
jgi:hypothetical protein